MGTALPKFAPAPEDCTVCISDLIDSTSRVLVCEPSHTLSKVLQEHLLQLTDQQVCCPLFLSLQQSGPHWALPPALPEFHLLESVHHPNSPIVQNFQLLTNPTILNPERKKKSSKQNVQAENLAAFALISERENMNEIHGKQPINYYIWRISM
jgi:hypothetical protein